MTKDIERFKANFNNPTIRQSFKDITGLNAKDNKEAFISFLNCLMADQLAIIVEESHRQITEKINRLQVSKG